MVKQKKAQKKFRCRGVITVEAAIVFPLIVVITLGAIEYGWLFLKAQQTTNAARQGARVAIRPGATAVDVDDAISTLMTSAGMGTAAYTVTTWPEDISLLGTGDALEVQVTVPCQDIAIVNMSLLPMPVNIGAAVTMAKEGP